MDHIYVYMAKTGEETYLPDTATLAKKLLNFAEETYFCYEDFSLSKKYLPCSKAWYSFKDNRGRIIVLCSKAAEIENRMYEISLYASVDGKIHSIIGLYDEISDFYYPKKIRNTYNINKYEKIVKNMWKQIKNEKKNKDGIKRSSFK